MSTKTITQRVRSVKSISQITKAMEVVSATKMRRSQEYALHARPYAVASLEILENLLSRTPFLPLLLQTRPIRMSALLVVSSDKGLAGAFNANVLKRAHAWVEEKRNASAPFMLITVGKKAKEYFERRGVSPRRSFWSYGDYRTREETLPVADFMLNGYLLGEWDEVEALYTHFRTTLKQETVAQRILPVTKEGIEEVVKGILPERGRYAAYAASRPTLSTSRYHYEYQFEPSPAEILEMLVPQLLRMQIHHIILESNASEHSARMIAMKNASENAGELIDTLTMQLNKSRQAEITRELSEITAGREALEN